MARRRVMKAGGRSVLARFSVPLTWRYGRDLTDAARRGQLDLVIGRDEELSRLKATAASIAESQIRTPW